MVDNMSEDLSKKYAVVTTVSTFHHYFVVPMDKLQELNTDAVVTKEWLEDSVVCNEVEEFSQKHIGELICDSYIVDEDKMLEMFDQQNDYLAGWTRDKKIEYVRKLIDK
jgi:hypothetical protein